MSPCIPFSTPEGTGGFVCTRGSAKGQPRRYCVPCLKDGVRTLAPFLCDFPVSTGKTCDAAICEKHALRFGFPEKTRDHCPEHA